MTITGLWLTNKGGLWVLEEISRLDRLLSTIFKVRFVSSPNNDSPLKYISPSDCNLADAKYARIYLLPRLVSGEHPDKLEVVSLEKGISLEEDVSLVKDRILEEDCILELRLDVKPKSMVFRYTV